MPLFCPKCKKTMDRRVDKPYYNIHKFCLKCYAKFTDKLKAEGKYEEYFNKINNKVLDQQIDDFKQFVEDKLLESNQQHIAENGDLEKWHGKLNKEKVDEHIDSVVEYLESLKR